MFDEDEPHHQVVKSQLHANKDLENAGVFRRRAALMEREDFHERSNGQTTHTIIEKTFWTAFLQVPHYPF